MDKGVRSLRRMLPLVLLTLFCLQGVMPVWASENDKDFNTCGMWLHSDSGSQTLGFDLKRGCDGIKITANASTLWIEGSITAQRAKSEKYTLNHSNSFSRFCVFWEPLLDRLVVEVNGKNFTLYGPYGLQERCCTDLSAGDQRESQDFGIVNGTVRGDLLSDHLMALYEFKGQTINCTEEFCIKATSESRGANMIEDTVMRSEALGKVYLPCAQSLVVEMKEGFAGYDATLPAPRNMPTNMNPKVHLPACLKPAAKSTKVVCTYYNNSTLFQQKSSAKILDNVVGISVQNEIIRDLPEPIRIMFQHSAMPEATCHPLLSDSQSENHFKVLVKNEVRKCVSWDTRKDNEVTWRSEGCRTVHKGLTETECCCNHLTYFAILVQVNPNRSLRHLEALTFITAIGCAVSLVSCLVLFVLLCKKSSKKGNDKSKLEHRGLVAALFFLCLFFILTGTVGNLRNESVCQFMGALLHYSLLCALCWMAVEVIHTFLLIKVIFNASPKPWIWYLVGFGLPVLPVVILAIIGNIYGGRIVTGSDGEPYRMCWMTDSPSATLAHYIINVGLLAALVISGFIMLVMIFGQIANRDEWRNKRIAFLSIWGLSCLFGTTWMLAFFNFGPFSEAALFIFCIVNSLQGFFLLLRFYVLKRMQKKSKSSMDDSSTGSTRQHMLQREEKS